MMLETLTSLDAGSAEVHSSLYAMQRETLMGLFVSILPDDKDAAYPLKHLYNLVQVLSLVTMSRFFTPLVSFKDL